MTTLYDYKDTFDIIRYELTVKTTKILNLDDITLSISGLTWDTQHIKLYDANLNTKRDDTYIIKFENIILSYIAYGDMIRGKMFNANKNTYENKIKTMYNNCVIKTKLPLSNDGDRFVNCHFIKE